jgi:aminopeptidase-like protein
MQSVIEIAERLYPYSYGVVGTGNDAAIPAFQAELPPGLLFSVLEFPSGAEKNGWVIPPAWRPLKAVLRTRGRVVYDAMVSPLGVPALCPSVKKQLTLEELKPHLYFSDAVPSAVPYHWTNLYRPGNNSWGLCMPKKIYDALEQGDYEIDIVTENQPGTMKVLDCILPGDTQETIIINAHNCHAYQANDDISGCAAALFVFNKLAALPKRRYTYRLVIAPELIGTVHWLDSLPDFNVSNFIGAILLKSVGNNAPLKLQESYTGKAEIDRAANNVYRHRFGEYEVGGFRSIYGNDETVFEAPGYCIPTVSLTRIPFLEYHTDADTPERLSAKHLLDTVETTLDILAVMENNRKYRCAVKGLVALSHPNYDLYLAAPAPGIDRISVTSDQQKWNLLMNCLPRLLDGQTDILAIADRYNLPFLAVEKYIRRWLEKGLAVE